jgi:hypothetical protein
MRFKKSSTFAYYGKAPHHGRAERIGVAAKRMPMPLRTRRCAPEHCADQEPEEEGAALEA